MTTAVTVSNTGACPVKIMTKELPATGEAKITSEVTIQPNQCNTQNIWQGKILEIIEVE